MTNDWDFQKAYAYVQNRRFCMNPHEGFKCQLKEYEPIWRANANETIRQYDDVQVTGHALFRIQLLKLLTREQAVNPDVSDFMDPGAAARRAAAAGTSTAQDQYDQLEGMLAVASLFGSIRDRPALHDNAQQQRILDDLVSQLLAEANASGKGSSPPASVAWVAALPTVPKSTETCAVCVDAFPGSAVQLPCEHVFHADCIKPWLALHNTCPNCRTLFPTDDEAYEQKRRDEKRAAERAALPEEEEEEEFSMYG
ncbi:hypothetical protein HKX48_008629 [Thoreauomyces humboldtii]|nr:hypothetical protein HKX48_008629 [Thoreauomyces humboldtii]